MPWLLRDGQVLATLEIADSFDGRLKGLLGRESLRVVDMCSLRPNRVTRPRRRASAVVEAEAGSFDRWGLKPGDQLEIRGA